ncbi:MAG: phosphoribosylformylglycinamidine synthase subunit PurQ [Cytophagia bacterium]|nr:MAG: phosphoribosylformylglycinamidine synthase subunit PurQ [Cytophagales bacterium]TAG19604.1 MAG: phosphoribosylformylglycinamidine synthase subunit PurQ [Cytophagales bacterium]TAG38805.1 MAG: phosphoribosylformylglycinamidine synthase subunit PurQ [Cytophagia bacterium]TAG51557.1 MAG: phosphoribosylformylglycinamidine synthase subunit PurQ [Runella slithyformis]
MKFGVVVFPGSNCDDDTVYALRVNLGQEVVKLWHKDHDLQGCDFVVLPGGFSYGDYLRSGAIARFSPIMDAVIAHAQRGGYVMGICNGFQVVCEAGLVPGVLLRNNGQRFISKNIYLKAQTNQSILTSGLDVERAYKIPIAHADGRYFANADTIKELQDNDQILFKYCDANGVVSQESNPNGSLESIAGVCNKTRNVFGMMPHPERAADEALGNADGKLILQQLLGVLQKQT